MDTAKEQLRIWAGERQLLPMVSKEKKLLVRCISGEGYLRVMTQTHRQLLRPGDTTILPGGEIATLSGIETMLVEVKQLSQDANQYDC
jgi:hypothetical protein